MASSPNKQLRMGTRAGLAASNLTCQLLQAGKAGGQLHIAQIQLGQAAVAQGAEIGRCPLPGARQQGQAAQCGQCRALDACQDGRKVIRGKKPERQALKAGVAGWGLRGRKIRKRGASGAGPLKAKLPGSGAPERVLPAGCT
jgi:hypothetical protein